MPGQFDNVSLRIAMEAVEAVGAGFEQADDGSGSQAGAPAASTACLARGRCTPVTGPVPGEPGGVGRVPKRMRMLCALKRDQHIQITGTFLTKGDERLVFRRVVPSVEGIHI